MNALETAIYNVITAASTGVTVYNEFQPASVTPPFAVLDFVSSETDDTSSCKSDIFFYDLKVVDDSHGGLTGAFAAASYADKVRTALTGPGAVNVTGSLTGYTCTDCQRMSYIKYLDQLGFWHVGYQYRFRVTK
jgi:hypothetical protein